MTEDPTRGWPTGPHDPATVEGRIEQAGKLADGLRGNAPGRRRAGRMVLGLVVAAAVLLVAVLLVGALVGR